MARAQMSLGVMYGAGLDAPRDAQQALLWYLKAADQGLSQAQLNLGLMHAVGRGVPKDDQLAYFWWLLASDGGDGDAIKSRDMVKARITPEQRAAAQADARNWKPRWP